MANTFIKIQTVTVGSGGAASIDFTSIPQTYTDLKLVHSLRITRSGQNADGSVISFNSSTSGFSAEFAYGNGTSAVSGSDTRPAGIVPATTATASVFGNGEVYIPNYTSANHKHYSVDCVSENDATLAYIHIAKGIWANTAAITSITLSPELGTGFTEYSSATLYGIKSS